MENLRARIFEGIDILKIRKCRPDRETIAHYILRKYGTKFNEVFNELEEIVDEELLVKVEFKGSISYRLPNSFDTKTSPVFTKHSKILNSVKTTRLLLATVNELLAQNEHYTTSGIPLEEFQSRLEKMSPERFHGTKAGIAIERELGAKNGKLSKSVSGRLYPSDIPIPANEVVTKGKGLKVSPKKQKEDEPSIKKTQKRKQPDSSTTNNKVYAVKSRPLPIEPEQAPKTYEGRFFTLVGGTSSEPSAAIATGFKQEQEFLPEDEPVDDDYTSVFNEAEALGFKVEVGQEKTDSKSDPLLQLLAQENTRIHVQEGVVEILRHDLGNEIKPEPEEGRENDEDLPDEDELIVGTRTDSWTRRSGTTLL